MSKNSTRLVGGEGFGSGNVEEWLRGGMVGVEKVKKRNDLNGMVRGKTRNQLQLI